MTTYKISDYDPSQITRMGFDDQACAHRVIIEGSTITIPEIKIPELKFPDNLKIDNKVIEIIKEVFVPVRETIIERIEVPVIVKEKEVEIREVIKEIPIIKEVLKVEIVEKPVVMIETKVEIIEKPVFIEKTIEKMSTLAYSVISAQTIGLIILTILLLKK